MSRILVTGASGFVGQALVEDLAAAGYGVVAAVREPARAKFPDSVEVVRLPDLAYPVHWKSLIGGISHVVHLAGLAHKRSALAEQVYDQVNHRAVAELAAAAAGRVQRLIFVSSINSQSGSACDRVVTEIDQPQPTGAYGRAKLAAERSLAGSGVPHVILRPVLIYGPNVRGNMARLIKLASLPLWLPFGALRGRRSLLAIDNLIAAIKFSLHEPAVVGQIYIVSDAEPVTLPEIITTLRAATKRPPRLLDVSPEICATLFRLIGRGDMWDQLGGSLIASSAKLRGAGWRPVTGTIEGLAAMAVTNSRVCR
jgi:UDP-glucose 4-epimerase